MSHRFIVLGLFLVVIVLCVQFCPTISQADEYEYEDEEPALVGSQSQSTIPAPSTADEYEYEYEDEEPSATHFQQKPVDNQNDAEIIARNGFIRHGGGLMKIGRPLMDDIYVNETMDKYDCVRFVDSLVHIVEPQEEDDDVMNVTAQIQELKQKMDRVMYMAAYKTSDTGTEGKEAPVDPSLRTIQPKNETQANATEASEPKRKRMSFREKQALRLQQRKERELAREALRPKFRLGADCETLICGSCKAIVDEFGQLVFNAIRDPKVKYIDQLTENFCGSKMIMVKYMDLVHDVCGAFEQETLGYKEALVSAFEGLQRWEDANKLPVLARMKKQLCSSIGACEIEQFDFQTESFHYTQDQWDDQCFTCQAFAKDLEERVHLTRHLTERNIVPLVAETCDRLDLDPHYRQVCQPLTEGKLLDDVAWLAKMHGESVARKAKAELKFPDKLCQEIDWCKPWIDPDKLKEMEAEANMEQVFF